MHHTCACILKIVLHYKKVMNYIKFLSYNFAFLLFPQIPTSLKIQEHDAVWLQPLPQPIPTVPTWDYMRRRYCVGATRKMRSNLTIPTLNETPQRIRRIEREEGMSSGMFFIFLQLFNKTVVREIYD